MTDQAAKQPTDAGKMIDFGMGMPNPELLPTELLRQSAVESISSDYLNYNEARGNDAFLDTLAAFLATVSKLPVEPDGLMGTGGALQIIHNICANLTNPGDVVFVEEPTFYLMPKLFRDHGLQIVPIPVDADGLDVDYLEHQLKQFQPAFVYTIPAFHNPTSVSMSMERKQRLVALSQQHNFLIVADEVYQLLYFDAAPPPSFAMFLESDHVLVVGSFSKILAPGLRLGWLQTSPKLLQTFLSSGLVATSGGFNHFTSGLVANLIDTGQQLALIERLRSIYTARVDVLDRALRDYLPAVVEFGKPAGGYFFWLQLPDTIDALQLRPQAQAMGVDFQPGSFFSSRGSLHNFIRLSFGYYDEPALIDGAHRLGQLLHATIRESGK